MSLETLRFVDHEKSPLIGPSFPDWLIADPCVLQPHETPDGRWHLFANAIIQGIQHFVSDDGLAWERVAKKVFGGIRPFIFKEGEEYHIFYEAGHGWHGSATYRRVSRDLVTWSEPQLAIAPQYDWEGGFVRDFVRTNGNPCVVKHEGRYRLYFSAGVVFLRDCLFFEPRVIGVAEADAIEGPYEKRPEPLIQPAPEPFFRNFGAGSMKVLTPEMSGESAWYAFNNGIYLDAEGHSRSEIRLLKSADGYAWELVSPEPLVAPTDEGWKRALVYAMHVIRVNGQWRMYYNARDGWFIGKERIGLALGEEA